MQILDVLRSVRKSRVYVFDAVSYLSLIGMLML